MNELMIYKLIAGMSLGLACGLFWALMTYKRDVGKMIEELSEELQTMLDSVAEEREARVRHDLRTSRNISE